jgi:hypothetical protein
MPPDPRKIIVDILKESGIIDVNETGKLILHLANGALQQITAPDKDVLKKLNNAPGK